MRYTRFALASAIVLTLGGCSAMLGIEKDYILREPITVHFGENTPPVTIPAGTRVKRTFLKSDVAFVQLYGTASNQQLETAGGPR